MTFVGEVNRVGRSFVRPPRRRVRRGRFALVERRASRVRGPVELRLANGEELWAQTTRDEAQRLELVEGAHVRVRPRHAGSSGSLERGCPA